MIPTTNHDDITKHDPTLRHPRGKLTSKRAATKTAAFEAWAVHMVDIVHLDSKPNGGTWREAIETVARTFNIRPVQLIAWCEAHEIWQTEDGECVRRHLSYQDERGVRRRAKFVGHSPPDLTIAQLESLTEWTAASQRLEPFRDMVRIVRDVPDGKSVEAIEKVYADLDDDGRAALRGVVDAYLTAVDIALEMRVLMQAAKAGAIAELEKRIAAEPLVASTTEVV